MPVWPLAVSPCVSAAPTICGSPSLIPKPFRKPSCRSAPTEMPARGRASRSWASMPISFDLRLGVLADQLAGLEVVRREKRVDGALRLGRRVERDHDHARGACLLDRRDDRLGVGGHDEDALGALRRHVLDRGDLTRVVRVGLAGRGEQLDVVLLRRPPAPPPSSSRRTGSSRVFVIRPTVTSRPRSPAPPPPTAARRRRRRRRRAPAPQQPLPRVGAFRRAYDVPMHLLLVGPSPSPARRGSAPGEPSSEDPTPRTAQVSHLRSIPGPR